MVELKLLTLIKISCSEQKQDSNVPGIGKETEKDFISSRRNKESERV